MKTFWTKKNLAIVLAVLLVVVVVVLCITLRQKSVADTDPTLTLTCQSADADGVCTVDVVLSGLPDGLKFFDKGRRSGLTRRGQHVGLDQPLIKAPAVDGNAINKLFVSEMHRQRNGAHLCAAALWQIDGRVDKNADGFHRVSSCSAAHSRSRLPQINSSAAYILLRCSSVRPMLAASSIEAMRACRAAKTSRPRSVRYRGLR